MKKFKTDKKQEYFAYRILANEKIINKNPHKNEYNKLFDKLLFLLKPLQSPFFDDLKIWVVLSIKWEFDYLSRYLSNPLRLNKSIRKYIEIVEIYINLAKNNWIENIFVKKKNVNEWSRTNHSFNFMWPRNTKGKFYNSSKKIITPRVGQIIKMLPKNFIKNSIILDSGCGPARYINEFLKHRPKLVYGMDQGKDIIKTNKRKYSKNKKVRFLVGDVSSLNFKNNFFDFVCSSGVLHHSKNKISNSIQEHARVLKKTGYMFVFIVGHGGMQLKMWQFCRDLLEDVKIEYVFNYLKNKISPLRLQGFLDHSYGEYQETKREDFEKILKKYFTIIRRVPGIEGADCTPEIYRKDKYFKTRFGSGDLRYICKK